MQTINRPFAIRCVYKTAFVQCEFVCRTIWWMPCEMSTASFIYALNEHCSAFSQVILCISTNSWLNIDHFITVIHSKGTVKEMRYLHIFVVVVGRTKIALSFGCAQETFGWVAIKCYNNIIALYLIYCVCAIERCVTHRTLDWDKILDWVCQKTNEYKNKSQNDIKKSTPYIVCSSLCKQFCTNYPYVNKASSFLNWNDIKSLMFANNSERKANCFEIVASF